MIILSKDTLCKAIEFHVDSKWLAVSVCNSNKNIIPIIVFTFTYSLKYGHILTHTD